MNKKKILSVFLVLGLLFIIYINFYTKSIDYDNGLLKSELLNSNDKIEKSIKIGVDNRMPPYSYVNDNGIIKGFYIDILRAIALEKGIDIEIYPMPWNELEVNLNTGEIDGVFGMSYDINNFNLILSDPVFKSSESIFVRNDNKYIVNIEDLQLSKVALQNWHLDPDIINRLDKSNVYYVENHQQGIQMMMMGQVEAFIGDTLSGLYTIQKWKQDNFIKIVGENIETKTYHIALNKDEEEVMYILNKGLEKIINNDSYNKISDKWFGKKINSDGTALKNSLIIAGIVLGIILLILMLIIRWNKQLKLEVGKQTTEVKKATEKLEEILNSLLSGIVTFTKSHEITYINASGVAILGIQEDMLIKKNVHETIFSDFFRELNITKVVSEDNYFRGKEIHIEHNNIMKTFNCNMYPLKEMNDHNVGYILNFRDISEEKRIRNELKRKDRMEALGFMVGGLAHEIRNPLTSIKALIDLIPSKIDNPNFREKIMEIVPNEIKRLNDLITNLLEYSKPKALKKEKIYLSEVFRTMKILFSANFKSKNIIFEYEAESDIIIFADKNHIQQILINVVLNSIEAIKNNGKIVMSVSKNFEYNQISIKDSGSGIDQKNIDNITDPFFTTKAKGTGLGLYIVYQLINEDDGIIDFEINPEGGTIVNIKLPNKESDEIYE